jgi:hypothetical protein
LIAREIHAGRRPDRFPKASMYNDIDTVAMYSPFCDAMFVDKEIAHLTNQRELREELGARTRFFSLRQSEKTEFLDYLDGIEGGASAEHLQLVEEVLGQQRHTSIYCGITESESTDYSLLEFSNAIGCAKFYNRSHSPVIRVYDEAGNVIQTHEHAGDFKEW